MNRRKLFSFLPALAFLGFGTSKATSMPAVSTKENPEFVYVYFFHNYDPKKKSSEQAPTSSSAYNKKYLDKDRHDVAGKCYSRALQYALARNFALENPRFIQSRVPLFGKF